MHVPSNLLDLFRKDFENQISNFLFKNDLIPESESLASNRFLARSIAPHVKTLSKHFNRLENTDTQGIDPYWSKGSNPKNLRLAYFTYFMPAGVFKIATIWAEMHRLGFRWENKESFKAIELGAGPATASVGIAIGEHVGPLGLPKKGNFALLEQNKAILELGVNWAESYFTMLNLNGWSLKKFHKNIDFTLEILPRSAPKFDLWIMSLFLNELKLSAASIAKILINTLNKHLEKNGIVIIIEPALKNESRRLLELRQELIKNKTFPLQVLLPCFHENICGALLKEDDWCHEEAPWSRPSYIHKIDNLSKLDHKSLNFSYLVLMRSEKAINEILPKFQAPTSNNYRLVSPAHKIGKITEFYACGTNGKLRCRNRPPAGLRLKRGDIITPGDTKTNEMFTDIKILKVIT